MDLKEVMKQKSFAILGDTLNEDKFAYKIKQAMLNKDYKVSCVGKELESINDINEDIDVIDLCIHPAKGLKLIKECKKPFKTIVIQPGASDDNLIKYLNDNNISYIENCLLIGIRDYVE